AQPLATRTELTVDLFPREQRAEVGATQRLENRSSQAIDTLHLVFAPGVSVKELEVTGARPGKVDPVHGYRAYVFGPPLEPGASATLRYAVELRHRGFANREGLFPVRENGTFLEWYHLEPSFGYDYGRELTDAEARRRNGLPPREAPPAREAPGVASVSIFGSGGGTEYSATISTDADQVAVAPGELVSQWSQGGRAYFRYETARPLPYYAVLSGRWAEARDRWGSVDIVVYYHPTHGEHVGRMLQAVRETLEYGTSRFGPFPFSRVAILEMPRTLGGAASALPGVILYGEDAGFTSRIREGDIDLPFYITAHEVGHHWWGFQLVPADARGSGVLREALPQYTSLMVMKHHFGRDRVRRFLRYEMDRYRVRRGGGETPLAVSGQSYIHYQKGAVAMFALQERLGEEKVNEALRGLLREALEGSPPFPTTLDLMRHFRGVTPDSLLGFLEDTFDRIVLYDNRITTAEATPLADGRYALRVVVQARKMEADSTGVETDVPMDELMDLVVYGASTARGGEPPILHEGMFRLTNGESVLEMEVEGTPDQVVLDPFYTVVDRTPRDNERSVVLQQTQARRP
ncbi:MAG: hypothetical protein ABIF09_05955, partial [Gemmatimonadota bacterium]